MFLPPLYITLNYWFTDRYQGRCKQGYFNILQAVKSWETTRSLVSLTLHVEFKGLPLV